MTNLQERESQLAQENWVRMPRPRSRFYGLSRTTLDELHKKKAITCISIKREGAQRGIKLLYLPSLDSYLSKLAAEQTV
jgi:hypothetical protein